METLQHSCGNVWTGKREDGKETNGSKSLRVTYRVLYSLNSEVVIDGETEA